MTLSPIDTPPLPFPQAITTCARAAEYRPPPQLGIHLDKDKDGASVVKLLPEELFVALECCLDDQNDQVKRAAAITLYTLERPVPKVTLNFGIYYLLKLYIVIQ